MTCENCHYLGWVFTTHERTHLFTGVKAFCTLGFRENLDVSQLSDEDFEKGCQTYLSKEHVEELRRLGHDAL